MSIEIKISLNEKLYLKNPQNSKLGQEIIKHGIILIDNLGFEAFTFKKLSIEINCTEASVYRYFENKHLLLTYLVSWYWEWMSYLININTMNVVDSRKKLKIIIHSIVSASRENPVVMYVNESILQDLVISEGMKAYHTKEVDTDNSKGFFSNYKALATQVSKVILEVNPTFKYPYAFATTLFEMANNHIYFAKHLPKLTEVSSAENEFQEAEEMLNYFVTKMLG